MPPLADDDLKKHVTNIVWNYLANPDRIDLNRLAGVFADVANIKGGIGYRACHTADDLNGQLINALDKMNDLETLKTILTR